MKIEVEVDLDEEAAEIKACMGGNANIRTHDMVDAIIEHVKKLESEAELKDAKIAELGVTSDGLASELAGDLRDETIGILRKECSRLEDALCECRRDGELLLEFLSPWKTYSNGTQTYNIALEKGSEEWDAIHRIAGATP